MKNILLILPIILLTACGQTQPLIKNPEQVDKIVFQAQSYYNVAVLAETAYDELPLCPDAKPLCSDPAIKKKVRKIDDAAYAAIKEAQVAARTPGFGEGKLTTFVTTATALTKAFTDITATLPKKE